MATCGSRTLLPCGLLLLLVLCSLCEGCKKVKLRVPSRVDPGMLIGKVNLEDCLISDHLMVLSSDPDILVEKDGSLYARRGISMTSEKRTLTLGLHDLYSQTKRKIKVQLIHKQKKQSHKTRSAREAILRRTKRRWAPQPVSLLENSLGPFPEDVQMIQSDTQENYTIFYSISGAGVNEPPFNLFFIIPETGQIKVNGPVDREEYCEFHLIGYAKTKEGYSPESPLLMVVRVEDDNDNAPQFTEESFCTTLYEHSKAGTVAGRVNATDRDEPGTIHTLLKYSIIGQFPASPRLFAINADTGIVTVLSQNTDREQTAEYVLLLKVQDMGGQPYSLSSTGTMTITIADINDHPPTFTASSYQGEVNENEVNVPVLCIPVQDNDQINTPNWRANFSITSGNDDGKFEIVTNPETNEGCLRVVKPLNYEEQSRYQLQVGVANEAALITKSGSKTTMRNTVPVTVLVRDVDEGPEFMPNVWFVRVKEGQPVGTLIYTCSAKDPEKKTSDGISYKKLTDPSSWVNITSACQIKTTKVLNRESADVSKGHYNVTVLATDQSGKTGTGTLVITVDDVNDNEPSITKQETSMCLMGKKSVNIEAQDLDEVPNSVPLKFSLDASGSPDLQSKWRITQHDGTSMTLEDIGNQPVGTYNVPISIVDQQGKGSVHQVTVDICNCPDGVNCPSAIDRRTAGEVSFGPLGILALILTALLPLLLLGLLLLKCLCGGAAGSMHGNKGFPDDLAQQNLIVSNTEAPGEEVMDANFKVPIHISNANLTGQAPPVSGTYGQGTKSGGQQVMESFGSGHQGMDTLRGGGHQGMDTLRGGHQTMETYRTGQQTMGSVRGGQYLLDSGKYSYSEWQNFMQGHLGEKLHLCRQDEEHQRAEDYVLPYNYEGKGSMAGSVGCCSDIQAEDERFEFSKTLEPKFRTLADICTKK
ncbi:desmocollin-2 [Ambystoma mexicanum]|uniref:desmocollin-2 n=1 Tax=Ambystoma mexicanum TaxID=8296 RepID=UPI0037E999FA